MQNTNFYLKIQMMKTKHVYKASYLFKELLNFMNQTFRSHRFVISLFEVYSLMIQWLKEESKKLKTSLGRNGFHVKNLHHTMKPLIHID